MAKAKERQGNRGPAAGPRAGDPIERYLLFERLRGPALPGALGAAALLVWVLTTVGVIGAGSGVSWVGSSILGICLFFALRRDIDERTTTARAAALGAFAVLFAVVTIYPLHRTIHLEPAVATQTLEPGKAAARVQLGGRSGPYRLVVQGHLPPAEASHASQEADYVLAVRQGEAPEQRFAGKFTERWSSRRLGRRGTAPVHVTHSVEQHTIDASTGEDLQVRLESLVPAGSGAVTVEVHPDPFPRALFAGLGVLLGAAAVALDAWGGVSPSEGVTTVMTLGALLGVAAFRRFAPAQPGFGDLLFNGAVGGLGGWAAGTVLWRGVRRLV